MNRDTVYLVAAAGTGGHVFPALAVAAELQKTAAVYWLGTDTGMEGDLVKQQNIPFYATPMKGFRGKSLLKKLLMPLNLLLSLWLSIKIIWQNRVDVVVGFGGYVTLPCGIAARLLGKKLVLHEQNSVAGSANKILAKIASKVLVAYPDALPHSEFVGNPVRENVIRLHSQAYRQKRNITRILVMGGSLGAEAINLILPEVLQQLGNKYAISVWHQTGRGKLEKTRQLYEENHINQVLAEEVRLDEFLSAIDQAYQWADLVICRAGALTVSELTVAGLPAIFIPYPWAIDNHQFFNAKWLVDQQAAELIEQKDMTTDILVVTLEKFLADDILLKAYANTMKQLAQTHATQKVVDVCAQFNRGESNHAA